MKTLFLSLFAIILTTTVFAQEKDYQLSTHILDISIGKPAGQVEVRLEKMNKQSKDWKEVSTKTTKESGRINDFLPGHNNQGVYRFTFYTKPYFNNKDEKSFYPFIQVVFEITGDKHYHVPITLSQFGYSTYRGS